MGIATATHDHAPVTPARFDVVIAGAGVVGAALASALRELDLNVIVVAPMPHDLVSSGERAPVRPIALSFPSRDALGALGLLNDDAGTPIRTIHVSQRGRFGRTVLHASEHGLSALGFVFDAARLERGAYQRVAPCHTASRVVGWSGTPDLVNVTLDDGAGTRRIDTRLLVLADGGALARLETVHDYSQVAWFGTVHTNKAHANIAYERFTNEGPLALLPFGDRYAFVWATSRARADTMPTADDAFCAALAEAFGERLGRFDRVSPRSRIPLALKRERDQHGARVVAIGNAAQMLHPVAGQGLNLGLRDALELAKMIRSTPRARLGDAAFIRAFARKRWADRTATITATDLFARIFSNADPVISALGGLGLAVLDAAPHARGFLARRMMLGARGIP
ncbi:MAG: FAD-dependent monooxygenase [Burkholderiales bacterium]